MSELVVCVICARGGSKGLHRKNLRMLDGEPLIARPIRHAQQSGVVDEIIVSTDDLEIAEVAKSFGAKVPFIRPFSLSGDLATTESTIQHALLEFESISNCNFDIGVHITATDVFRDPNWIKDAVNLLKSDPTLESVFSGHQTQKNFWQQRENGSWERLQPWMKVYSSRQIRRSVIREDTGLACASRASLWREGRRIGDNVQILINDDSFTGIDIHTEEDLALAEAALSIRKKRND
jgi:CMP-N,N'-diacetyllegionaminic acid synthase